MQFKQDCERLISEGKPIPVMFLAEQCDKLYEENIQLKNQLNNYRDLLKMYEDDLK